ncbi:hypothetical protein F0562_000911 [Nyssa sinensis]|uniref:SOSEKI DIX-like domain-containing protein n=1 Tax=Nyssa sinensis TaxID=561372 RepID=A0A5J5C5T3_9ASTE|nr:hypothetical protein F0562_000911 [Nyssa sinensis]
MEVPLSSPEGLYLRDVINRLNFLRGKGMCSMYSWSSKRSYKNGFVWHDLAENDFIYPAHGQEYVLKGSELLEGTLITKSDETVSSCSKKQPPDSRKSGVDSDFQVLPRRRNQSWSAIDFHEYKVYKSESSGESSGRAAANASTQTDDKRRRRRALREVAEDEKEEKNTEPYQNQSTELGRDEISPPPSDSSPETLESLMKADGRLVLCQGGVNDDPTVNNHPSGRLKASSVLMQLISCGSISFKDCGPTYLKDQGFSLISHYKPRLPRGRGGSNQVEKDVEGALVENPSFGRRVKLEDKEYFSGSLIETRKDEFPALKRSSSYNADRSSQLDLGEKEIDGVRAKCIPRKPKTQSSKKENNTDISCSGSRPSTTTTAAAASNSQQGSKRSVVQP